jgi:transposase
MAYGKLALGLSLVALLSAGAFAASGTSSAVSPADQLQFQQKTAQTQMEELQERMFHLADLTRESEPDDSTRLLMALRKARESLIIEQMRDVLDQISHADLSKASDGEAQVLVKLEELKKLLTSTDFDLQMQLERLHALTTSLQKLDAAIKEEKRQGDQSDKFAAAKKDGKLDPAALTPAQQDQKQNRQATDSIAQTVKDLGPGPATAAQTLASATQSMSQAESSLGGGEPKDAAGLQGQATDAMKKARDQLEAERQKILTEIQSQVRKQVIANLTEMLDRQKSVRGATEALAGMKLDADRQTTLRYQQLSSAQAAITRIGEETVDLINETQFSVALPPALQDICASSSDVSNRLQTGSANTAVVGDQKQIEHDLADLIDTFKELNADPGDPSQCNCKGNKNKLLAELKVLRLLQTRVNDRTARVDAERVTAPADTAALAKVDGVRASQQDVQIATDKIHQELSGTN